MKVTRILMALALTLFMSSFRSAFAHAQEVNDTGNTNHVEGLNIEDVDGDMDDGDVDNVDDEDVNNVDDKDVDNDHADRTADIDADFEGEQPPTA